MYEAVLLKAIMKNYFLIFLITLFGSIAFSNECRNIFQKNSSIISKNNEFIVPKGDFIMEAPHPKFPNKIIKASIKESLPIRITPLNNNGMVKTITIESGNGFQQWPVWEFNFNQKPYLIINIGLRSIQDTILKFHESYDRALKSNDASIIEIKLSEDLKHKIDLIQKMRWEVYSKVMNSYIKHKAEYLKEQDIFNLWSFDSVAMTSDVFVLIENPGSFQKISSLDLANKMKSTLQISYKKNSFLNFSAFYGHSTHSEGLLPFENRIIQHLMDSNQLERKSDDFGDVNDGMIEYVNRWDKIKALSPGDNFAELTRYYSTHEKLPKEVSKIFVDFVINQAEQNGVDTLLASGDRITTRLFSIYYGFNRVDDFIANSFNINETLSYRNIHAPQKREQTNDVLLPEDLSYGVRSF
jgi:hypothetical protein